MTGPGTLHRTPGRPLGWLPWVLGSQLLVAAAWWHWGWKVGLPLLFLSHAGLFWGILWPRSALYGPVLSRLPGDAPEVWLTIDDGPSEETPAVLDLLDRFNARATFFLVADRAAARPALVQAIVARGHDVGNHSRSHPQAIFWALGPRRMAREIDEAQAVLSHLAGRPPRWFRAVVGMSNPFVQAPLHRHGLARVAWSARGFDGVAGDPAAVVKRIVRDLRPGAIVLLHEGAAHGNNLAIIEGVLDAMRERRLRTVVP